MSKHESRKSFRFSAKHLFRLLIFLLIFFFLINYFSTSESNLTINPSITIEKLNPGLDLSPYLPKFINEKTRLLSTSSAIIYLQNQTASISAQISGFPQKQIRDIKKQIITEIYQEALKSIDQP